MGWARLAVYTLTCDVSQCEDGTGHEPASEGFLPPASTGLRGAEQEARRGGWTVRRARGKDPQYACPRCTRDGKASRLGR